MSTATKLIPLEQALREQQQEPPQPLRRALPVLTFAELAALDIPERTKLLPWLPEGALIMIHAPRGLGKTWFALSLATALITGGPFLKWQVAKPVGVLVVDGEMDLSILRERIVALAGDDAKAPLLTLSHQHVFDIEERDMNFGRDDWQERLKTFLEGNPEIKAVIFDNKSCLWPTTPEDSRDDYARDVLPLMLWLRRRGIIAMIVHHSGKSGQQRGTSANEDQVTTTVRLDPVPGEGDNDGARFTVTFTKSRVAFGEAVTPIEVALISGPDGVMTWNWNPLAESNEDRLLQIVRATPGLSIADVAEELGMSKGGVHRIKRALQGKGLLKPGSKLEAADDV